MAGSAVLPDVFEDEDAAGAPCAAAAAVDAIACCCVEDGSGQSCLSSRYSEISPVKRRVATSSPLDPVTDPAATDL